MATIDLVVNSNGVTVLNQTTVAAEETAEAVKSLNQQYTALKKQQEQFKPNTKEFKELTDQMVELKKQMKESADAVAQNTQPAVEGLRGTFATMKEQVMNFNFEGLTESLKSFTANLGRVNVSSITGSLKAMLSAGVQGFKALGQVILKNPIFVLAGVIIALIAYWKEFSDFVTGKSKMLENLKAQADTLKSQEQSLTRQLALQKALGEGAAAILRTELDMLANKQKQAEVAMEIAILEDDKAKFLEAQQQQLQAINDVELRRIKIHKDAQSLLDKIRAGKDDEYNKQILQNQAFSEYKARTEELGVEQQRNNERARQVNNEIADAQRRGNDELVKKLQLEKQSLYNQNVSIQSNKDEIWNAGMAAKDEVKTEKELAAIAAAKAKAAERKSAADAAAKKLADDILAIEQRIAEIQRASMDDQEQELYTMFQRQAAEEKTFIKAKKSANELAQLRATHEIEFAALTAKYDKEAQDKEDERLQKEKEAAQERLKEKQQELIDLQAIIDTADESNFQSTLSQQQRDLMASQDYYFNLISQAETAGLDTAAWIEEQGRKEDKRKVPQRGRS